MICNININKTKIVCQIGISMLFFLSFNAIHQMAKQILTIGDISKPRTAMKLVKKLGIGNFISIFMMVSTNAILQIMASRAIKAKTDLLNRFPIFMNCLQDKKIT
jgi:hypothetical protein